MGRRRVLVLIFLVVTAPACMAEESMAGARVIALFGVRNAAGDSAAATTMDQTLRFELTRFGSLVGPERTRDALRRLRIRSGDQAPPALLRLLGEELEADWLVSASVHDTDRRGVPQVTMSMRLYSSASGELTWLGFRGASGLDGRKLLGLGIIADVEGLVPLVVQNLLEEMAAALETVTPATEGGGRQTDSQLDQLAVVPFAGSTERRPTLNAETVTEAVRAHLFQRGVDLVSPNLTYEILRQQQAGRWEGVTADSQAALRTLAGADTILTGEVEAYELGGSRSEPRPRVAIAMRLLDADTGRILWTGALERSGWDGIKFLGLGRIYSRGDLTERMTEILTRRLEKEYLLSGGN